MTVSWLIKKGAGAPETLADAGVTACALSLRANGVDSLSFTQAGDYAAAPRWPFGTAVVFDLDGVHAVFQSQEVEVEDYPQDWWSVEGYDFIERMIPWLRQLHPAVGNNVNPGNAWSLKSISRSGELALPAMLANGSVSDWMGVDAEQETFTVEVSYTICSDETNNVLDQGVRKLTFRAVSTDARTKTYRRQTEWTEPEPVPEHLARDLFESWNRLLFDGSFTVTRDECEMDIRPGVRVSCAGGLPEWEAMGAICQDAEYDIGAGTCDVTTGTCRRLEADNLIAVYRAARGRVHSTSRGGRDVAEATDGNSVEGGGDGASDRVADGVPACLRRRFSVEAEDPHYDGVMHRVRVEPGEAKSDLFNNEGPPVETPLDVRLRKVLLVAKVESQSDGLLYAHAFHAYVLASQGVEREDIHFEAGGGAGGGIPPPADPLAPVAGYDINDFTKQKALSPAVAEVDGNRKISGVAALRYPIAGKDGGNSGKTVNFGIETRLAIGETGSNVQPQVRALCLQGLEALSDQQLQGLASGTKVYGMFNGEWTLMDPLTAGTSAGLVDGSSWYASSQPTVGRAAFDIVTDVSWNPTSKQLEITKKRFMFTRLGIVQVNAQPLINVPVDAGIQDIRYVGGNTNQLQKQAGGIWTMINGGQFVEES